MTNYVAWREKDPCQNNMEMLGCLKSGVEKCSSFLLDDVRYNNGKVAALFFDL